MVQPAVKVEPKKAKKAEKKQVSQVPDLSYSVAKHVSNTDSFALACAAVL